ncbi:hypothetical protein O3M35_013064 [Rhynocoris fuscipes]|uniref:Factor VIII intron 22 protein n=1 Tax=Rhynocoris fuscipes TaxID=488301 RepID=A0AAW1CFT9_9HEMI
MGDKTPSDFITQYKSISNKLKKKFLRKANASEPSDQFATLAAQCERCDLPQYAALSWLAVAKCESSLGHINEEATALIRAGRLFIQAENKNVVGCEEHLQGGISCLGQAENLLNNENSSAGPLCLETGNTLKHIAPHSAICHYTKACSHFADSPALQLLALGNLASTKISVGDYHGALQLFTDMVSIVNKISNQPLLGVYNDVLIRCEISRVLLILLLRPSPQKISPDLAKLIEKYTWIGEPDYKTVSWLGEELFFLLQSLVMASQCQELEAINVLETDSWKYFSNEQKDLLQAIIDDMKNSEK